MNYNLLRKVCNHRHNPQSHPQCFIDWKPPKILLLDIETQPALGYFWEVYETNVLKIKDQWKILCIAYKWLGGKTHILYGNEKKICKDIWNLIDKADYIVAYNGDGFDLRKIRSRLAYYGIPPPSPYKSYDPLKRVRKHFGLLSNKLGDVGRYFNLGEKIETGGKDLWFRYMKGDKKAQSLMHRYCKNDVELLEKVFNLIQLWEK